MYKQKQTDRQIDILYRNARPPPNIQQNQGQTENPTDRQTWVDLQPDRQSQHTIIFRDRSQLAIHEQPESYCEKTNIDTGQWTERCCFMYANVSKKIQIYWFEELKKPERKTDRT